MDLELRCVASHPRAANASTTFVFSTRRPILVTAAQDLIIEQTTSNNAIRSCIRASANVDKLMYVGGSATYLAFLENGYVASYAEKFSGLQFVEERKIAGDGRSITLGEGSSFGRFALFCKADSPSLWCIPVLENGCLKDPFKLRSDIEGDQDNVRFVGGVLAKVRGKVATKAKSRLCPIIAVTSHSSRPYVAAAYTNGIVRVWDIARKEQRNHFDAQLLISETIVDIAFHPDLDTVVCCTTLGRILTFVLHSGVYKRGDEPRLPTSKTRDRKRQFLAMCFMTGSPSYLLLLTSSRRVIVRMIDKTGLIVISSRYNKPSRALSQNDNVALSSQYGIIDDDVPANLTADRHQVSFACESTFGLIGASFDKSGKVYIFQQRVDGLAAIRRPIVTGLDTPFSQSTGHAFKGPIKMQNDSLIGQNSCLFSYELGKEQVTKLCTLPPGDIRRIEEARDEYGFCMAALVFYYGDDEINPTYSYGEPEDATRYVMCTRRGKTDSWNVSEPNEGRAGCFLNEPGCHDQLFILAASGMTVSIFSFAGRASQQGHTVHQTRGVQRFKLNGTKAAGVFRTPFQAWSAVLYYDSDRKKLAISKNAFERHVSQRGSAHASDFATESTGLERSDVYDADDRTALELQGNEIVIDVRWQALPGANNKRYLGAVMTNQRIYFVRDVLEPISTFEFHTVERIVVPSTPPTFSWAGPGVMVLFGNSLISVTLDGKHDLVAGLSQGENVTGLVVTLPDRVVYARPSQKHERNAISIVSRPYSALSGLVRGMLAMPISRNRNTPYYMENLQVILGLQDVSQGSGAVADSLIEYGLSPVAYLLATSEQGKYNMPPLKRAAFLGRIGIIRGALTIVEQEYARLPSAKSFVEGTELYRLIQWLLNVAFAGRDFAVGRRCSALLGRRGTFSAFVDVEGGYNAVKSLAHYARRTGNAQLAADLRVIIEKSSRSCVATDTSLVPSAEEIQTASEAVQSHDTLSSSLGNVDRWNILVMTSATTDEDGKSIPAVETELVPVVAKSVCDRVEMFRRDVAVELIGDDDDRYNTFGRGSEHLGLVSERDLESSETVTASGGAGNGIDSSDEDGESITGDEILPTETTELNAATGTVSGLSREVRAGAEETRKMLQNQREQMADLMRTSRTSSHAVMQSQRLLQRSAAGVSDSRAVELWERGMKKYERGQYARAGKDFEIAMRALWREENGDKRELLYELVYYKMTARVRAAMSEIENSAHANTIDGRIIYTRFVMSLTSLPLERRQQMENLVLAVDANMMMNNYGIAAHTMTRMKEMGVDEQLRVSLREKYAVCAARGFTNSHAIPITRLCFHTLRFIEAGSNELACSVCPARFVVDSGLQLGEECSCCRIGKVVAAQ